VYASMKPKPLWSNYLGPPPLYFSSRQLKFFSPVDKTV
jgi:hypothetical protein